MKGNVKVVAVAVLVGVMAISQAWAANINSFIVAGPNQASDEDREFLIDNIVTLPGQVDVGDALRGHINFNTVNSSGANLGGITGNDEFTGIFQTIVTNIIPIPGSGGLAQVTLAPDPAFGAVLSALSLPVVGGEVVALFTDSSVDFCADTNDPGGCAGLPNIQAFLDTATDGAFWATFGFEGAAGEGIAGQAPANIGLASTLTSGSSAGNINIALNLISTGPGFGSGVTITGVTPSPFGGTVDLAASQQLRGISDLQTLFDISTNTNVSFNADFAAGVPEPSTLLLFGGGLLGLGLWAHRRNKKA